MPNHVELPDGVSEKQIAAAMKAIYETINFGRLEDRGEATVLVYREAAIRGYEAINKEES